MKEFISGRVPAAIPLSLLEEMFDQYPDSPFFIKDAALRYVAVNEAMVRFCGARRKADLIGRRVAAFFPPGQFEKYEELDRRVLATGEPVMFRLDESEIAGRSLVWLLFHRYPLVDAEGEVTGIVATSRELDHPGANQSTYRRLFKVVQHITENSDQPLDLRALAARAGLSPSQLNRNFRKVFGRTAREMQLAVRLRRAISLLAAGHSVAAVAHACGYADQSAFTRRVREMTGQTPRQLRRMLGVPPSNSTDKKAAGSEDPGSGTGTRARLLTKTRV